MQFVIKLAFASVASVCAREGEERRGRELGKCKLVRLMTGG